MVKKADAGFRLLVSDVEAHAMGPVQQYLDGKTTTDALGRLWCSNSDAAVALEKANAAWQEEIRLRTEFATWQQGRGAERAALAARVREKLGPQASSTRVHEALWEALGEFDRETDRSDFYTWKERQAAPSMKAAR